AEESLTKVRPGVDILGISFQGSAIAGLGLFKFALPEINVPQMEMVNCIIEMMDLGLEFLDAFALGCAWEFETLRAGAGAPINVKEIENGTDDGEEKDECGPDIFPVSDGMDKHPKLENSAQGKERKADPAID